MGSLLTWVAERVAKSPRAHRFTVGDRLLHACLDVTENLVGASSLRAKRADLTAASRGLVRARVLMRLAHTLRCVSEAQHLHSAQESDEVGRMLGGWLRSAHPRLPSPPPNVSSSSTRLQSAHVCPCRACASHATCAGASRMRSVTGHHAGGVRGRSTPRSTAWAIDGTRFSGRRGLSPTARWRAPTGGALRRLPPS